MRYVTALRLFSVITMAFLYGCDSMWPDVYWRHERYVLLAIDAKSQMSLSFDMKDGTAIGLVGPTVFAIGANEKYIVVKQHPALNMHASAFDRSVTNYYIVERSQSPDSRERERGVKGPMNRDEFERLQKSLALPPFTKTFADLQ